MGKLLVTADPHYREYATVESLVARYGAKPKAQKRVLTWLATHDVKATLSPTHTFVIAKLSPRRAGQARGPAPGVEAEGGKKGSGSYGSVLFHTGTASGWGSLKIPGFSKLALAAWQPDR